MFLCSDHFYFVLLVGLLALVFSAPSQEIGWEGRLRNDPFCVEWDVEPCSVRPERDPFSETGFSFIHQSVLLYVDVVNKYTW